jgi:CHAD domain-containing protein
MHRKEVYRSIKKQGTGIREKLSTAAFFDAEDVHGFRTHVKKMRAYLHWLGKEKKPLPAAFKEIYKISGELRDLQVLMKEMEEKEVHHPAFVAWLQDNAGRLQQLWDDKYDPAIIRRLQKSLRQPELKKPTLRRWRDLYHQQVDKIESIVFLPAPSDDDLHDIRKELKDLYIVYLWGKKRAYTKEADDTPELLKQLGEQCGQFNDRRVALALLDAYLQQEQEREPREAAAALQQSWTEERSHRKKELLQNLRAFIEKS